MAPPRNGVLTARTHGQQHIKQGGLARRSTQSSDDQGAGAIVQKAQIAGSEQLAEHHDPVVETYARERLQQRQAQLSSGFLNGVIDLIIRRPSLDGIQHWVVLDWKTNRLVRPINDLMAAKDYWLQAQLYRQAVQRWLHWRLGEQTPLRIDAVMLFTRSGEGAWLLDEAWQP